MIATVAPTSSAGNTRGLIEGSLCGALIVRQTRSSAGNTRGLIEGRAQSDGAPAPVSLPRGIPAASLKGDEGELPVREGPCVFRGEYPRPH